MWAVVFPSTYPQCRLGAGAMFGLLGLPLPVHVQLLFPFGSVLGKSLDGAYCKVLLVLVLDSPKVRD